MFPQYDYLPPDLLSRSEFVAACEQRNVGRIFLLARKYAGFTNAKIARQCEMTASRVGEIANGKRLVTGVQVIERIADGLGIPGRLFGLQARPWEGTATQSAVAVQGRSTLATPDVEVQDDRPWEVVELTGRLGASNVNTSVLEVIEQSVDQLCRDYPHTQAEALHPQIVGWLRHTVNLTEGRTTLTQHRDLLVSAGWLFLIGGCVEYDLGWRRRAEMSRRAALDIAKECGHGEIAAWAWELEAWFALTQGRLEDVVSACEAGHVADTTHSVGVQLYAQQAKAYARMGDARQVRLSLDTGRSFLDRLERPTNTAHHFVIDPDKWDFYEMDAYRLLGDDAKATTHAREVLRLSLGPNGLDKSPMRTAEARLTLGVASARNGELEEATSIGGAALEVPRKSLPSLLMVANELDTELRTRYPHEAQTRDFQERLVTLVQETPHEVAE